MSSIDSLSRRDSKQGKGDLPGQLKLFDPDCEPVVEIKVSPATPGAVVTAEPATATLKRCNRCGCEKPRREFAKHRRRKDGLQDNCRSCASRCSAERRAKLKAGETVARNREMPRGVYLKPCGKYEAMYRRKYLGRFASIEAAATAYAVAAAGEPMGVPASAYKVDDVFAEGVGARHWRFIDRRYLSTSGIAGDSFSHVLQHIFVWRLAGGSVPDGLVLDHINHDRTDNRLANLRLVTVKGNSLNRQKPTAPKPRLSGRWQAKVAGKYLGTFDTQEQAQAAINAHVAGLIEQETVMHGADLLASYMATTQDTAGSPRQLSFY